MQHIFSKILILLISLKRKSWKTTISEKKLQESHKHQLSPPPPPFIFQGFVFNVNYIFMFFRDYKTISSHLSHYTPLISSETKPLELNGNESLKSSVNNQVELTRYHQGFILVKYFCYHF